MVAALSPHTRIHTPKRVHRAPHTAPHRHGPARQPCHPTSAVRRIERQDGSVVCIQRGRPSVGDVANAQCLGRPVHHQLCQRAAAAAEVQRAAVPAGRAEPACRLHLPWADAQLVQKHVRVAIVRTQWRVRPLLRKALVACCAGVAEHEDPALVQFTIPFCVRIQCSR